LSRSINCSRKSIIGVSLSVGSTALEELTIHTPVRSPAAADFPRRPSGSRFDDRWFIGDPAKLMLGLCGFIEHEETIENQ
jgi:hypothetical protein